ncbi:unnamed protein product [Cladocopium goreaui]|uniref:Myosin motor domain-containing protein n=1 Tax=Cladocopium goreaui TaxID=2562237 RepID=A0A9P1D8E3_9DINO|nr:unnamed protein product [Cladocopium goreaui]
MEVKDWRHPLGRIDPTVRNVKPRVPIYLATRGRIDPTVRNVKPQVPITCGCVGEEVTAAPVLKAAQAASEPVQRQGGDRTALQSALCNTRVIRTEKIRSPVNVRQAADNRDALAKVVYDIVFNYIVQSTSMSIGYVEDMKLFAGVLDIFGFECFTLKNSFKQLCINFTNERLQQFLQFLNSFVFKLEEQLYEREGIEWIQLDFPDNQDAVDMLQGKVPQGFTQEMPLDDDSDEDHPPYAVLDELENWYDDGPLLQLCDQGVYMRRTLVLGLSRREK